MQLNGAAARLVQVGDVVILMSYVQLEAEEARLWRPTVVLVGEGNRVDQVLRSPAAGAKTP